MSPIERRELIEEISNISGYEEKREKALKKLEKIDQGLKEADLLMEEKTKYLRELKSEKDQAEKYHQVKEDLRFNSILLVKSKLIKNANLKKSKEEELEKNEELYKSHKGKLDEIENNIKNIEIQIGEIEKEIEIKSHNDFISVTNKITALEAEVQKLKEKNADYKKQIEEIKSRNLGIVENLKENKNKKINLDLDIKNLNLEKDKLSKEISILETKIASLKKGVSSESFEKMDELELKLEELSKKKYEKDLIRQDNSIQIEKLNTKLEHLQDDMSKIEGMVTENKEKVKDLEKYRSELKKIIISVSKRANLDSEISAKIANLLKEQNILNEDFAKLQMKASASDAFISNNKAVEVILAFKRSDQNIHGTIFDLASSNSKYSLALETAAGKSLYNIVVNDDNTAVKYINYLKEKRIGNATFLPLNKINVKYK
ncbi:hypothetical protein EOM09_07060, partial [bacterium]|nr:hypothetical protein [bacterium]